MIDFLQNMIEFLKIMVTDPVWYICMGYIVIRIIMGFASNRQKKQPTGLFIDGPMSGRIWDDAPYKTTPIMYIKSYKNGKCGFNYRRFSYEFESKRYFIYTTEEEINPLVHSDICQLIYRNIDMLVPVR
jgi:hypothetical protein